VKFWDSSAIVPLVIEEKTSRQCRDLYRADRHVDVWEYTETEVLSGIVKQTRVQPPLTDDELDAALTRLDTHRREWEVVKAVTDDIVSEIKRRARRHMLTHRLRSGDALQLAAATMRFDPPMRRAFVVFDGQLADAAANEGFDVIRLKFERGRRGR
jgi:predicted nucleic acid-binding protein